MYNLATVSFFSLIMLACLERINNEYMKRGQVSSGMIPWLALLGFTIFITINLPYYSIAVAAGHELEQAVNNIIEYAKIVF